MSTFCPARLRPLGNTFLNVNKEEEAAQDPASPGLRKAHSVPEFIPYEVHARFIEANYCEQINPQLSCDVEKEICAKPSPLPSPLPTVDTFEPLTKSSSFSSRWTELELGNSELASLYGSSGGASAQSATPQAVEAYQINNEHCDLHCCSEGRLSTPSTPSRSDSKVSNLSKSSSLEASELQDSRAARHDGMKSETVTTLLVCNIPHNLNQNALVDELDRCGFRGRYDFIYMPWNLRSGSGKGYAFVNAITPEDARFLMAAWHNKRRFGMTAESRPLFLSPASIQGREANMARWSSSKTRRIRNPNHRPLVIPPGTPSQPPPPQQEKQKKQPQPQPQPLQQLRQPQQPEQAMVAQAMVARSSGWSLVGQWGVICGLSKNPEANGLQCYIVGLDGERYVVNAVLDARTGAGFTARLRLENIRIQVPVLRSR